MSDSRRIPIIHPDCGGQLGWWLGPLSLSRLRSEWFERMDGSHPVKFSLAYETCPSCERWVPILRSISVTLHSYKREASIEKIIRQPFFSAPISPSAQ